MNISKEKKEQIASTLSVVVNILIIVYVSLLHISAVSKVSNLLSLVFMFLICVVLFLREERFFIPQNLFWLIAFSIFVAISLLWSQTPENGGYWRAFRTVPLLTIMTILLCNYFRSNEQTKVLVWAIFVMGFALSFALIYYCGGIKNTLSLLKNGLRLGGQVENENYLGMSIASSAVVAFYFVIHEKKYLSILAFLFLSVMAFATGSRTGLLGLVVGVILCVLFLLDFSKGKGKRNAIIIILALVAILLFFVLLFTVPAFNSIKARTLNMAKSLIGKEEVGDGSTNARLGMFRLGWEAFKEHPFGGVGAGSSCLISDYGDLHNNYIEVLASFGIIGFILYFIPYVISLIQLIPLAKKRNKLCFIAIIINICWFADQLGMVTYETKDSYFYLALLVSLVEIMKKTCPSYTKKDPEADPGLLK